MRVQLLNNNQRGSPQLQPKYYFLGRPNPDGLFNPLIEQPLPLLLENPDQHLHPGPPKHPPDHNLHKDNPDIGPTIPIEPRLPVEP